MKSQRIRRYPPLIVSAVVMLAVMAAAASAIINGAAGAASEPQAQETPIFTQTVRTSPKVESEPPATAAPEPTYQSTIYSRDWDGEDSERLMKIAMAEAEGESVEGKALVMLVVLNRVWSDQFPNTIEEVIFQRLNGVFQFSPVREGGRYWTTEPNDGCREALELVLNGWDESQGALYFEAAFITDGWHSRNLEFLFQYGGHRFYR